MDYMAQALSLARLALGQVSPNPAVGAVVVRDDVVVGEGYTQPPGQAHAEIVALREAGEKAQGATLYVTLEPCCHYGRTPPCTRAIIAAGIAEVHLATLDDNPKVNGKGVRELENAGIKVYSGEHEEEARALNEAYFKHITTGMSLVTVKYAASLDGKIATRSGDSRWITGESARKYVHHLRYISDAVMVGVNTVIIDNPQLTVRLSGKGGMTQRQPLRVIVDSKGRTPINSRIFSEPGRTMVVLGREATSEQKEKLAGVGAELLELPDKKGQVELKGLLQTLGKRGIISVLVEGGGTLIGSLFDMKLVDKVVAFISPMIIGGETAKGAVSGKGIYKIADACRLSKVTVERFDNDLMITGYVEK